MDLTTAGDYLALAPGTLINLLRRENVSPVDVGSRHRRWRRRDLDDLVERLPRTWDQEEDGPDVAVDAALAAVERRAREQPRNPSPRRSREVRQPHPAA